MQRYMKLMWMWATATLIAIVLPGDCRSAQGVAGPLETSAFLSKHATQSVMLAVTTAGDRLVAVGERGRILVSDDNGATWRQMEVPVSVTLTAVHFVTPLTGWAVGHFGVVLKSEDGGETWKKQLDGKEAAQLVLESARNRARRGAGDANSLEKSVAEAQMFIDDGPDKPFLDLYFADERNGFVVGAYNLIFRTRDGGKSWEPWLHHVENPGGMHLYSIRPIKNDLYIAGEQGLLVRSDDGGESFTSLPSPYDGTYFGCISPQGGNVLVFGLQGKAFLSGIRGESWQTVETGASLSVNAGTVCRDGTVVLVTQEGRVLAYHYDCDKECMVLQKLLGEILTPLAGITEAADGSLVAVGMRGVMRIPMPTTAAAAPTTIEGGVE